MWLEWHEGEGEQMGVRCTWAAKIMEELLDHVIPEQSGQAPGQF